MRGPSNARYLTAAMLTSLAVGSAHGGVIEFIDKDKWIAAVGDFTTIDFTGFPDGTFITDQYADLGVVFTDGNDSVAVNEGFLNDGSGLDGNPSIHLSFDVSQIYLAVDFPGDVQIDLFNGNELLSSSVFIAGGFGNFAGVISSQRFNAAVISDPILGDVFIDDLHFGVPAPPTLGLLVLASVFGRRRRDSRT